MRELLQLAWPIAAAMFGETFIGLVDTKLVGGIGPAALGGVGIATMLMFLNYAVVFGIMRGVKVRTAFAVGMGRPQDGVRYARAGMLIGALAGVFVLVLARDISWALALLRVDPELVAPAREFLAAVTLGAPATCVLAALIQHRQAIGDSRTPMVVGILGNVFNAVFAYGMIYGRFGLPALGVRGAGYATAITENVELVAMLWLLVRDTKKDARAMTIDLRTALREVAELGVPTGLQFGTEMLAFASFTAIIGSIGSREMAAHQIALQTIRVSFLPGVAVGEAGSVLVGRALGQRRLDEADRVTLAALKVAVTFMASCALVFALAGGAIVSSFTQDPRVIAIARKLLLVAAVFQILDAVNIVLRGALRGAKDVRWVAVIGIGSIWAFIPACAWFLGRQHGMGALGGWFGFIGETSVGAALCWLRWKRGAWRKDYAPLARDLEACSPGHESLPLPPARALDRAS
jgi:MATE family multidrug resistance protein